MKAIITGGAGFIGSHIGDKLIELGHEVIVIDNLHSGKKDYINENAKFYNVDITNFEDLLNIFEKERPDVVFHLAAQSYVSVSVKKPFYDAKINIIGSINLLECCIKNNVKRIIYSNSGGASYGNPKYLPMDEKHPINPESHYGISKHTVEHYLELYKKLYNLDYVSLRYGNVFGPRQDPYAEGGVIAIFVQSFLEEKRPTIFGDGTQIRDYIYVDDVVDANILAIEKGDNDYFNIGRGIGVSTQDIFNAIQKEMNSTLEAIYLDKRPEDAEASILKVGKLKSYGWYPKINLQEGIKKTVEYFKKKHIKALILCAGEGTRLRPLTENLPKPMIKIKNKPILEYNLKLCEKYGISDIGINTSYLPEKIKEYFGDGSKFGVKLKYSYEPHLLGTSGSLNNFKDFFKGTFIVIYGDGITDIDLEKMIDYHKSKGGIATLALRKKTTNLASSGFALIDENSRIKKFFEKPSEEDIKKLSSEDLWKNSGIYIFESRIIDYIPEGFSDFGKDIFPRLLEAGEKLFSYNLGNSYFREVGKIEKYENAKREIESGSIKLSFNKNRAIFLDKDGVINEIVYEVDGKILSPAILEQVKIIEGVKEGIQRFKKMGFKIIGITNQPGIAFGYINKEKLEEINEFLKKELGIDEIYYCPHHPQFTGECSCRKPKTELIERAKKDFNLDVEKSYFVGDSLSDIQTGKNMHVRKTFRIGIERLDIFELQHKMGVFPDFTLPNLIKVAEKIREIEKN